jgi:glycerol-3-phosphate dehydrogenase
MLYFENRDGRICIFYPVADRVISGTTDIPVDNPETAVCTEEEVDYILDSIRQVFPSIQVDRSHIVYRFSGVRPLPRSDAVTTGQISRDHSAPRTPPGNGIDFPIYSLIGGKWTTFRAFGEQVADELLPALGMTRRPQTSTADMPIGGGRGYPEQEANRAKWVDMLHDQVQGKLTKERILTLLDRYGTRAADVINYTLAAPDAPLEANPAYTRREILFMVEEEYALHIDDILMRRTLLALLGQVSLPLVTEIAGIMADALGWTPEQTGAEIERTLHILETRGGVRL